MKCPLISRARGHSLACGVPALTIPGLAALLLVASVQIIGCGSTQGPPPPSDAAFQGPPVSIEQANSKHVVVVQAPSAGWTLERDATQEQQKRWDVYITIRQPDPRFIYTQQVVSLRATTDVRATEAIRVLARVVPFADTSNESPHHPAASADPIAPPTPK